VQANYSILTDGSATRTGWNGIPPPQLAQDLILQLYETGKIKELLAHFFPIGYSRCAGFFAALFKLTCKSV
jgi:hypothetical protein